MRVPLSWLADFAPFGDDWRRVAATLDDLGLVVEGVEHVGEGLGDVVVARVTEVAAIPKADRIRRVVVDDGRQPVQVVCGAFNFGEGDLVALAPVGTVLPGDFHIGRRTMRGVESDGMLCSARELGLGDDHAGILVLASGEPGTPLTEALGVRRDVVFDVAVETNRPDAFSIAGVARDLAARLRLPFALPEPPPVPAGDRPAADLVTVAVVDDDLCPRFTATVLTGVEVGPSPARVARRLALAGMRPINNVVDASNYVMLELGQPTHPYDLDRIAGGGLRVRAAAPGEKVTTLDGTVRAMGGRAVTPGDDRRDCLICDGTDAPVGVAGIMGGESTEITDATTAVLLEAAYFDPMAVARTAKRLGLRTEASARFERGCDPEGIDLAVDRLVALLAESVPGLRRAPATVDVRGPVPAPARVAVRTDRVNAVLGTDLDTEAVTGLLQPIGFACAPEGTGALLVDVPSFRPDTTREIDVIEEVARHHGYGAIARRRLHPPQVGGLPVHLGERRSVRQLVAGLGAHEAWTSSLLGPDEHRRAGLGDRAVAVANPQTPDESVLRRSLLPGMLQAVAYNLLRRAGDVRLFEIGRVFPVPDAERLAAAMAHGSPEHTPVDEREVLALALAGPADDAGTAVAAWSALVDTLGIEGVHLAQGVPVAGLHPGRRALVVLGAPGGGRQGPAPLQVPDGAVAAGGEAGPAVLGEVGEVDPEVAAAFGVTGRRVGWLQLDLGRLLSAAPRRPAAVRTPSRYPSSDVDLAFVAGAGVTAEELRRALAEAGGDQVEAVALFDVYRAAGAAAGDRSLAFRVRFCADDHTLTDDEIGALRRRCIDAAEGLGARIRG